MTTVLTIALLIENFYGHTYAIENGFDCHSKGLDCWTAMKILFSHHKIGDKFFDH
jgi:hypothetical protein